MSAAKLFISRKTGDLIMPIRRTNAVLACDGEPMEELTANTTDAAQEKHVPVVKREGNTVTVTVGSVPHPMTAEHLIQWIFLQTKQGGQYKMLSASDEPKAIFALADGDEPIAAYEYCNLHGLWKAEL